MIAHVYSRVAFLEVILHWQDTKLWITEIHPKKY